MKFSKLMHERTPIEVAVAELARIAKHYGPLSRMAEKDVDEDLFHELADRRRSLALGIAAMTPVGWDDAVERARALHLVISDEFYTDCDGSVAALIAACHRDWERFVDQIDKKNLAAA